MPWSGSAGSQTFARTDGTRNGTQVWQQADAAGIDIVSPDHDTHDQDLAAGINACVKKDGGNTATSNLPMGGFKHTNVASAAARNQYASFSDVQDGKAVYYPTVGGTADAITITGASAAISFYAAGQTFQFIAASTNSGPATINVDGAGNKNITGPAGTALSAGQIVASALVTITYDGTQFQLSTTAPAAIAVGFVAAWPMTSVPSGWLECDGSAVSRSTYAALFAVYGTAYGVGNGSSTFNLPNYKDYFLRGFDASGTEAASRTDRGDGTTGAAVGTKQASAFLRHNHTASVTDPGHVHPYIRPESLISNVHPTGSGRNDPGTFATDNTTSATTGISVTVANTAANDSTSETRPKNITVKWCCLALPAAALPIGTGLTVSPKTLHTGGLPARISTDGTDSTPSVTETYICEVLVPANCTATGISVFNGSAAAGNICVALANSLGAVVASSASTAASGTDAYQDLPFTASASLLGPSTYYVLLQCNNTGQRFNSHTFGRFGASKKTGETFGTFTTITPPTTFTTGLGPIATLY